MSDPGDDAGRPGAPGADGEPVGSVGEEAAKLFGALSDWARTQGPPDPDAADPAASQAGPDPVVQARAAFAQGLHDVGEHVATGSTECRWCPVCQVIHVVRQTSPEVREQLSTAAVSLLRAAAGLLATTPPSSSGPRAGVERIDLDDETTGAASADAREPGEDDQT